MKKLFFLLLLFVPFWGFSQLGAGDFIDADTTKVKGESLIYPAQATGEHYYKGARNPSDSLDVVNLRFLFQRLAELDSLGLLVSDMVSGSQIVNEGETQITFPSQFDTGTVVVVPYVRRLSDNAVIDYLINDVDSMGFDIVVWEDNIKVSYMASNRATNNFSMLTAYVNDSTDLKRAIRAFERDSGNYVWFKDTVANEEFTSRLRHTNDLAKKANIISPVFQTNITTPLIIGGTAAGSNITYKSTTGTGTTTGIAHQWLGGTNGGTILGTVLNNGNWGIGTIIPNVRLEVSGQSKFLASVFPVLDVTRETYTASGNVYGAIKLERILTGSVSTNSTGIGIYYKAPNELGVSTFAGLIGGALSSVTAGNEIGDIIFAASYRGADPAPLKHLIIRAVDASTANVLVPTGSFAVGTMSPTAKLHVVSTTEQLRLGYDVNNYNKFTVNSTGDLFIETEDTIKMGKGSNYTAIEPDGTLILRGSATVWDDVNTGVAAAKLPAANYPAWTAFTANTNAYTFAVNDYADLSTIEIPHGYKEGSNLEVHCHIATNGTNNATARKVQYLVYYTYCVPDNGSYQFSAEATIQAELTIPANQPDKSGYYISLGTITGTGLKIGTQVKLRFKRIASTGTEPINDPFVGQVAIHYEKDTEGSRTISIK